MPAATAASAKRLAPARRRRDQTIEAGRGRGAAALFVQRDRRDRRAPASRRAPRPAAAPAASRTAPRARASAPRAGVVGVVDDRDAVAETPHFAAAAGRRQRGRAVAIIGRAARRARWPRRWRTSTFARLPRPSSGTVQRSFAAVAVTAACSCVPSSPRSSTSVGAHVGAARRAERDHAAGETAGARHHPRVVGVADEQRRGPAPSRISAFASAIASAMPK